MSPSRMVKKRERSVNSNPEGDYRASDGEKRPCKRLQRVKTPSKLVQPQANKKHTVNEQAARSTSKAKIAEKSLVRTANPTMTEPELHKTSLRYVNREPVDRSRAVVQTGSADDQDTALISELGGFSGPKDLLDQKEDSTNKQILHNSGGTGHTTRIIQKRQGRFLSDKAYPGVLEPDVVLKFQTSSGVQKTLWLSDDLQERAYAKMHGILSGKRKKVFSIPELQHIRKSIRHNKPIPLKVEHAQRYMLNWLKAWAVIYRQTADLRSYSGSIWLRGIYSTVELDRGEEEIHMVLDSEQHITDGYNDEDVAAFEKITALQIEQMHARIIEESGRAGTGPANVSSSATGKLALRQRPPSVMQSIEVDDSSPSGLVPFRASRQASTAMSLSDVSSDDQAPGNHNRGIASPENQVRGAFRDLLSIMQQLQTPFSPSLEDTAADTHEAGLLPHTPAATTNNVKGREKASQATPRTKIPRPASQKEIIDLTSNREDNLPGSDDN